MDVSSTIKKVVSLPAVVLKLNFNFYYNDNMSNQKDIRLARFKILGNIGCN